MSTTPFVGPTRPLVNPPPSLVTFTFGCERSPITLRDRSSMTTRNLGTVAILTIMWVLGSSSGMRGADWPSFRGPGHDGKSTEAITWPRSGPKQLWKINVGIGHSAVSVVGDRAYTMGNTNDIDTVFSIDVATGRIVWTHSYPCNEKVGIKNYDGPFATPTVANGVVYTLSRKGDVFALNARDGKV